MAVAASREAVERKARLDLNPLGCSAAVIITRKEHNSAVEDSGPRRMIGSHVVEFTTGETITQIAAFVSA